jgi:hypothetical protein
MTTRLTGYSVTIPVASDTYVLAGVDPQAKSGKAVINIQRNGGYDGTLTLQSRPAGSSAPFVAQYYTTKAGAIASAALTTGNDQIFVDATGLELAFVSSGATVGSATITLGVQNEA